MNVKRTVLGYQQAGFACVMIEDQVLMPTMRTLSGTVPRNNEILNFTTKDALFFNI